MTQLSDHLWLCHLRCSRSQWTTGFSLLLKDSRVLEGKLVGYDDYMNMVLDDTEERTSEQTRRLGTVILRGNNVVSISPV